MAISFFDNKSQCPGDKDLNTVLGAKYDQWKKIREYLYSIYPRAMEEWKFSGKSYGWSFHIKDRKRVIIYFIPCEGYFKVAFVLGEKATREALFSPISKETIKIIEEAPVYAEGRGFRIDITDNTKIEDVKKLITIKLAN
jgi:hypothetical protein